MNKRFYAFIVDYFITATIQGVLMMILIINSSNQDNDSSIFLINTMFITFISVSYLIFRDVIGNRSVGKKIFKLEIIDKKTKVRASFLKRIIRNITWLLGPIEIFYFIIKKNRIGDKVADTIVIGE